MKKLLFTFLKVVLPLALGLFLIWYYYQTLTEADKLEIRNAFSKANYAWIWFSLVFAILSHMSRAYRWKYTLEPLGLKPKFLNSFFSVLIGYLVNLAVPRLGEVSRCGVMSRYEKMPFQKLLGTVIAERIADFIILIIFSVTVCIIQIEIIGSFLSEGWNNLTAELSWPGISLLILGLIGGLVLFIYVVFLGTFTNSFILKIRSFLRGMYDGIMSIVRMKQKWAFLFHTLFIWAMYIVMFYVCFFSLPETSDVPWGGILTSFVLGGFAIVFTNGGIGAYPLVVMGVLTLYNVDSNIGNAFGWIVWTAQTVMFLVLGGLSFLLMPIYNRNFEPASTETNGGQG